jgi:oligopeptide/dipeptide ABC transporter ATP-binding protein
MTALLEVKDVGVRYPTRRPLLARLTGAAPATFEAVIEISFTLEAGTTMGIVGESGSGKSTLGRAIMGLTPIHTGIVRFMGHERAPGTPMMRELYRNMSMIFQDPVASLSPRLTVKTLITEPYRIHGIRGGDSNAQAQRLLDLVGLPSRFLDSYPHQLSGGQARRVGVARALALEPRLIIADEPTAGLDVSVQGEILNLLARLQQDLGLSYIIITHNLPLVRQMCDQVAVMYMGRFVERGCADAIFERPAHPYTHGLMTAVPYPDPTRRRTKVVLPGEVPSLVRRPSGCEFHTRCNWVQDVCRSRNPEPRRSPSGSEYRCHFPLCCDPRFSSG